MTPLVSVIVPVYNVADFIERCAESLFRQSFSDMEYIFVNDCSPDDAVAKLNRVLKRFPNRQSDVKIIHHERNRGIAAVRNTALKHCTGKYIISVDGDDFVEKDMVAIMYAKALETNADIVVCDLLLEWQDSSKTYLQPIGKSKEDFLRSILSFNISVGLCNKMFRRQLIADHHITAPEGNNMGEDFLMCSLAAYYSRIIAKVDYPLYHYVQTNHQSYNRTLSSKSSYSVVAVLNFLDDFFQVKPDYNLYNLALKKGKLRKKIEFIMYSDTSEWKDILNLFPETDNMVLGKEFSVHEKVVFFLIKKKATHLLKTYKNLYLKTFNVVQKIKGR